MTVLIIGMGSAGDVLPNVGVGLALKKRGHRVILIAAGYFDDLAARTGLEFIGLGTKKDFHDVIQNPDLWHPYRSFSVVARHMILPFMRPVYEIIKEHHESGRVVVAAPATAFGARIANEKLQAPLATLHLQPAMLRSRYQPSVLGFPDIIGHLPRSLREPYLKAADRFIIDPLIEPATNAFREELGLPPVRRLFDRWMHSPQLVIGLFPDWFAPPQPDWPDNFHTPGFPLYDESGSREIPAELTGFLDGGEAPVVFTAGSAMAQGKEFFKTSVEVCRAGNWRGLLLTQFPEQLPASLPDGVQPFGYVPFSAVLPRAAAFVHHGGIGTTAQALAAGVPQLIVPMTHDQPDNAVRILRLGVGDFILPYKYKTTAVTRAVDRLIKSDSVKDQCRRRAGEMAAANAIDNTCLLIEQLGGAEPSPPPQAP